MIARLWPGSLEIMPAPVSRYQFPTVPSVLIQDPRGFFPAAPDEDTLVLEHGHGHSKSCSCMQTSNL